MTSRQRTASICLSVALLLASPGSGLQEFDIPQLRQMTQAGVPPTHDYIMNLVMMGLPNDLVTRIKNSLRAQTPSTTGFSETEAGVIQAPNPPVSGQTDTPSAAANSQSDEDGVDFPDVTNIDASNPILLRKRRSFDDFFSDFGHGSFSFGDYGLGDTGYNNGGFNGFPSSHPGDQNGNFYGGNARGFIQYPNKKPGLHNTKSSSFHFGGSGHFDCPRQVDQGFVYHYSPDLTTYPGVEIGNELFARSLPGSDLLFQSLSRQIVFPTDPPQIYEDPFIATANATCRIAEFQVWSYQSQTYTGRCYPLVNFQEIPFYKTCLNRFCKCQNNRHDVFSSHGSNSNRANVCITEYQTLSLWSYCERLVPNRRIVRDRILVPDACTCSAVDCYPSGFYKK